METKKETKKIRAYRFDEKTHLRLKFIAGKHGRSMTNMLEMLIANEYARIKKIK